VAANYDLRTRQPYWVIELAAGRDSAVVTAGKAAARRFSFLRQSSAPFIEDVRPIVALMEELEAIFPDNAIEIEFGLAEESPILFQCRATPVDPGGVAHASLTRRVSSPSLASTSLRRSTALCVLAHPRAVGTATSWHLRRVPFTDVILTPKAPYATAVSRRAFLNILAQSHSVPGGHRSSACGITCVSAVMGRNALNAFGQQITRR
jgi:hypothetical protein